MRRMLIVVLMGLMVLPTSAGQKDARRPSDTNRDGRLDARELAQYRNAVAREQAAKVGQAHQPLDLNRDGRVSGAEQARAEQLKRLNAPAQPAIAGRARAQASYGSAERTTLLSGTRRAGAKSVR